MAFLLALLTTHKPYPPTRTHAKHAKHGERDIPTLGGTLSGLHCAQQAKRCGSYLSAVHRKPAMNKGLAWTAFLQAQTYKQTNKQTNKLTDYLANQLIG